MAPDDSEGKRAPRFSKSAPGRCTHGVLLAEDDDELRELLVTELTAAGFKVTGCSDAVDLVNILEGYLENRAPMEYDLIVSDIRMPWLSGMELLKALNDYIGFPPVVLITAFGDEETHRKAKALGAAAVLDKPFEMATLVRTVRTILEKPIANQNWRLGAEEGAESHGVNDSN